MAFEFGALEVAAGVSLPELPVSSVGSKPGLTGLKPGLPRETPCEVPGADSPINPRAATEGTQPGKSTTNLDEPWNPGATPEDDYPREECGVFGVWAPGEDVSRLAYFGLYALQHRGQESAGIATSDGSKILVFKDMGLVSQVFSDRDLATLTGHIAVGHVRYATAGASSWRNAQPTLGPTAFGTLALAHNGNLVNARELAARVGVAAAGRAGSLGASGDCGETRDSGMAPRENETTGKRTTIPQDSTSDTMLLTKIIGAISHHVAAARGRASREGGAGSLGASGDCGETRDSGMAPRENETTGTRTTIPQDSASEVKLLGVMRRVLPQLDGAYSLTFMDETTLYAARDPHGIRPLVLGRLAAGEAGSAGAAGGWVVASETAALDIVGAVFVREIEPGELLAINENGVHSERFAPARPAGCVFEYVYLARPDTQISGRSIISARREMGAALAREDREMGAVLADIVMATPDSGTPAAIGYAEESGIPFVQGLVKNAYVGRTFIQPTQTMRQMGIRLKLNPVRSVIEGKRLVVIDDSIVRGNTQRAVVRMLREAGAREVHIRISSPPVLWPCFYGIDFATREELIATELGVSEICRSLGADSLAYLRFEAMVTATGQPEGALCTACFSGRYPTGIPQGAAVQGAEP